MEERGWKFVGCGGTCMESMLLILGIIAGVIAGAYMLYLNGWLIFNFKMAIFYKESRPFGKAPSSIRAKFRSCNGVIKRVIRLKPGKQYQFVLSKRMTKGAVHVEIRTRNGESLLTLDDQTPKAVLAVQKGRRYYAVIRFEEADGEYALCWNAE